MVSARVWRVPPAAILHWRAWDREFVVYHEQSGDTHRLNAVSAAAIRILTAAPLTASDLVARLAAADDLAGTAATPAAIDDLLGRLSDVGLVESLNDDSADAVARRAR